VSATSDAPRAPASPEGWRVAVHAALCLLLQAAEQGRLEAGEWTRADELREAGETLSAAWGEGQ
jgi:hypothetical protein